MKKLILLFMICILLVGTVSAFDWDNVKSYDKINNKITIKNAFGLPLIGDDLAQYTLVKNTDQCLIDCYAEGTAILYTAGYLFTDVNFKNKQGKDIVLSSNSILIKVNKTYDIVVSDYGKETCEIQLSINGSKEVCTTPIVGSHIEQRGNMVWEDYKGQVLEGSYEWRVEGRKAMDESVDWIGESFGEKFTEWAWWDSSWVQKQEIKIEDTAGSNIANYTVDLLINISSYMKSGLGDIRFLNGSETTELGYWIYYSNATSFKVRIKVDDNFIPESNISIFMYYNNSGASTTSDIANAHIIGEDGADFSEWTEVDSGGHINLDTSKQILNFTDVCRDADTGSVKQALSSSLINFTIIYQSQIASITTGTPFAIGIYDQDIDRIADLTGSGFNAQAGESTGEKQVLRTELDNVVVAEVKTAKATGEYWVEIFRYGAQINATFFDDPQRELINNTYNVTYGSSTEPIDRAYMILADGDGAAPSACASGWISNYSLAKYVFPKPIVAFQPTINSSEAISINVKLLSPADNIDFTITSIGFQSNVSASASNLTNMTLEVYNPDGSLFNSNTTTVTGINNETNLSLSSLTFADGYKWNYNICAINSTITICSVDPSNRTFNLKSFVENSQTFTNITTEGNVETFIINITTSGVQVKTADLIYNNTINSGTFTFSGNEYIISETLTTPNVGSETNISFFWNITVVGDVTSTSSTFNQTVRNLTLDNCGTNPILILNYTLLDEDNQTRLTVDGSTLNSSIIEIDVDISPLGSTSPLIEFSDNFTDVSNATVCVEANVLNNTNYRLDVQARYQTQGRQSEYHHIQNFTLNNNTVPQNINLLDLVSSRAQIFTIIFKDSNLLPVENALIDITRKYINEGVFKSVEVPKTDEDGKAVASLVLNEVTYTILVKKDGILLGTFNNVVATCDNILVGDCSINLNSLTTKISTEDFATKDNLIFTLTRNEDTNVVESIFSTVDGSTQTITLNVTLFDNIGTTQVCTDSLTSSTGTISCTIPSSVGNATVKAEILVGNNFVVHTFFTIKQSAEDTFGGTRIIMIMVLFITLPLLALTNGAAVIIMGLMGLIIASLLNIFEGGSLIGLGSTILWFVIAGGIILWKISQRE